MQDVPLKPEFSVVVPVSNEAPIIRDSLSRMFEGLRTIGGRFEVVVCENGSTDETLKLAEEFERTYPEFRVERLSTADYGLALIHGIRAAKYDTIVIFNIEFWNVVFVQEALPKLAHYDLVIGSKRARGGSDRRPVLRRVITWAFNSFLRMCFDFGGTDTHGIKAFRRQALAEILGECVTDQWIFDTEFVLRAERRGLGITEIPVHVEELRQPSYWSLVKRTPHTVRNIIKLARALRSAS